MPRPCVSQVYFENWKEKNIFADLFHKPDTGIDPGTLDLFKQECRKDKLIFTATVVGPSRTQVGRLRWLQHKKRMRGLCLA